MLATSLRRGALLLLALTASPAAAGYIYYSPVLCRPLGHAPGSCGPGYYALGKDGRIYGPNYDVYPPFPPFQGIWPGTAIPSCYHLEKQQKKNDSETPPSPASDGAPFTGLKLGSPTHAGLRNLMAEQPPAPVMPYPFLPRTMPGQLPPQPGIYGPHLSRSGVASYFAANQPIQQVQLYHYPGPPALQFRPAPPGGVTMPAMPQMPEMPQMPMTPMMPGSPTMPAMPQMPTFQNVMPQTPNMTGLMPPAPAISSLTPPMPPMPVMPRLDQLQQTPGERPDYVRTPAMPVMPAMPAPPVMPAPPAMPQVMGQQPATPSMPVMPAMPAPPVMPAMPVMPVMPVMPAMPTPPPAPPRPPVVSFPTHPYARSPRDFFMWSDVQDDPINRGRRGTYVP